jgi:DNA repair protein RadC
MDFFNCLDGLTPREAKILEAARKVFAKHLRRSRIDVLDSPGAVRDYLRFSLGLQQRECFHVTFLNAQNRIIDDEVMFTGTLTQTSVYPREIVKAALARNAAAVLLSHFVSCNIMRIRFPVSLCDVSGRLN